MVCPPCSLPTVRLVHLLGYFPVPSHVYPRLYSETDSERQGYHAIPQTPPIMYGPGRPYSAEKAPSIPFGTSEPCGMGGLSLEQPNHMYENQTHGKLQPDLAMTSHDRSKTAADPGLVEASTFHASYGSRYTYSNPHPTANPETLIKRQSLTAEDFREGELPLLHHAPNVLGPAELPASALIPEESVASSHQHPGSLLVSGSPPRAAFRESLGEIAREDQQSTLDILQPHQRGGKRGPFKDQNLREQTAQTRRMGSCIRCRMQRIRVSFCPLLRSAWLLA